MLGAAIGHAWQIALIHNMAPGNDGVMFCSDIVLPVTGAVSLGAQRRVGHGNKVVHQGP